MHNAFLSDRLCRQRWVTGVRTSRPCQAWRAGRKCSMLLAVDSERSVYIVYNCVNGVCVCYCFRIGSSQHKGKSLESHLIKYLKLLKFLMMQQFFAIYYKN